MQAQARTEPSATPPLAALHLQRAPWVDAFARTLLALNPQGSEARARDLAGELWRDLGHFDPVIAAEMEFESSLCDA